jgi:hypothetical protein
MLDAAYHRAQAEHCLSIARTLSDPAAAERTLTKANDHERRAEEIEKSDLQINEWNVLKNQFDALVRDQSAHAETIEALFDVEFRRRFNELILQTARRSSRENVLQFPRGNFEVGWPSGLKWCLVKQHKGILYQRPRRTQELADHTELIDRHKPKF